MVWQGFGIAAIGFSAVEWKTMAFIAASWVVSPFLGGIVAFIVFKIIAFTILHRDRPFRAAKKVAPIWIGLTFFIVMLMFFKKGMHIKSYYYPVMIASAFAVVSGIISFLILRKKEAASNEYRSVENIFQKLQIMTSCYVSLAHGANDVANAIGPLAAIYAIIKFGSISSKVEVPKELLFIGGIGISLGVAIWGTQGYENSWRENYTA